jgi:hypothetical protein
MLPVSRESSAMAKRTCWVISVVIIVAVVGAATLPCIVPRKLALTQSELKLGSLPLPPAQPTQATVECSDGLTVTVSDISRDWSVVQDHPPCTVLGLVPLPVKATAAEMVDLKCRPQLTFRVAANGKLSRVSLLRSSGSKTLDERSLRESVAKNYPRHNCGVCKFSTVVDVDFNGPVWMLDYHE